MRKMRSLVIFIIIVLLTIVYVFIKIGLQTPIIHLDRDNNNDDHQSNNINNNNNKMDDNLTETHNKQLLSIASNNNKINDNSPFSTKTQKDFYIGLTLALMSSFFIGSSFILKKKGLLKLLSTSSTSNSLRAGQGGYGYLKEWLWWGGLLTMGVGELCNFAAYGFAPATLVTPLGALSVLVSAILSAYFLNEKLNTIGKIGCILTAIGSTVMVIHAPKEGDVRSVNELLLKLKNPEFIAFTIIATCIVLLLIFVYAPTHGNRNILVYILICSILGSFTVMSCKGVSIGLKESFVYSKEQQTASTLYTYLFGIIAISCIIIQMNYLNKSLDIFNTAIVTTVYYVLFTLCVMIASSILFKELTNLSAQDFLGCLCGFSTIICALCLIHFFKVDNNQTILTQLNVNHDINGGGVSSSSGCSSAYSSSSSPTNSSSSPSALKRFLSKYINENFLLINSINNKISPNSNTSGNNNNNLIDTNNSSNNNYVLVPTNDIDDDSSNELSSLNNTNNRIINMNDINSDEINVRFINTKTNNNF